MAHRPRRSSGAHVSWKPLRGPGPLGSLSAPFAPSARLFRPRLLRWSPAMASMPLYCALLLAREVLARPVAWLAVRCRMEMNHLCKKCCKMLLRLIGSFLIYILSLWLPLGVFGVSLAPFGMPWSPFGCPLGPPWPSHGCFGQNSGFCRKLDVQFRANGPYHCSLPTKSSLAELAGHRILWLRLLRFRRSKCCSEPPFYTRRGQG